jgi:hypothetical protein
MVVVLSCRVVSCRVVLCGYEVVIECYRKVETQSDTVA